MSRPVTDEDIKKNRKYGSYCFTEPEPGVVYAPFGGGYSTVGTSVEAGSLSDTWLNAIWNSEKYLRENIARIVKLVYDETGKQIGPKMKFLLGIEGRDIYALEVQSRVFLKLDSI
ncbi:hypothetical protein J1TS5_03900 [Paenibacillus macerans]|nr:hypothetical protein J1TS5_03900 [Paenibacillus macerans]